MASVLLVDDEKVIRNGLTAIISRTGTIFTEIDQCSNGLDACQLLSQRKYDMMITDLLMPQMDGIELVSKIDGMAEKPYTLILSGHEDFRYAQKAINYGVKAYLLKPVDRNELVATLKKAEAEILSTNKNAVEPSAKTQSFMGETRVSATPVEENPKHNNPQELATQYGIDFQRHGLAIDRAIRYVRENYGKDLSMAEVANRISLNYSYFSLLFKGKTGMNFIDYLKSIRIEKAKELLKSTDYRIYEISEMVGYNNTKHFTTMFRECTGISPKEFRERIYLT